MYSRKRLRNRALLAAASSTALLVGGAFTPMVGSAAGAVVNPGVTIETWPELDFVAVSYPASAVGSRVTVEVFRAGTKIGEAANRPVVLDDGVGIVEINHVGNDPEEGNDCWNLPHTPDIRPGDEIRAKLLGSPLPADTSVVRDVKLSNTRLGSGTLTFNGWVRSTAGAPVNAATDTLELRVEPYGTRENLTAADLRADGTYSHVMSTPGITADQVEEAFLEWANAGGEDGEASEITVSTYPELTSADVVEMGCPPHGGPVDPGPGTVALAASPTSLSFGEVQRDTTSTAKTVTVTNSGTAAATGVSTSVTANFTSSTTCGATLAAGASCTVSVSARPTATGPLTGTLTIDRDGDGANPLTVALSVTGTAPPAQVGEITVLKNRLQFGLVKAGRSTERSVTVRNEGPGTLTVTGVSVSSGSGFSLVRENCDSLADDATCRIVVRFNAALPKGPRTGVLTITSNDKDEATSTVALLGRVRR